MGAPSDRSTTVAAHLFVYGTLMRGFELHPLLDGATWIGRGTVAGRLHDMGGYPALLVGGEREGAVRGEVYRLPEDPRVLARLDVAEGCGRARDPAAFARRVRPVRMDSGGELMAWLYVGPPRAARFPRVAGGDYREHRSGRR